MDAKTRAKAHETTLRLQALMRCAMLAEENDTSGLEWNGVAEVLAMMEEMTVEIRDAIEPP